MFDEGNSSLCLAMTNCGSIMDQPLRDIVCFVRKHSPYYAQLYQDTSRDTNGAKLRSLPLVDHRSYWIANTIGDDNTVRTGPLVDGVIFKTGGTTGNPKFTALNQAELQRTTTQLGSGLAAAGLQTGDRIANMFYAGELGGSFLLHVLSIMVSPTPAVHVPIGGLQDPTVTENLLVECGVTAILSTVTSLVRLAQYMLPRNKALPLIRAVMFGGEALYPDQRKLLSSLFPNATFRGCIFGSMDGGVIGQAVGVADVDDDPQVYQVQTASTIREICADEEGHDVIIENGVQGDLVATSLTRRLTPVIRYPTGDRGEWVDYSKGIFRVSGRGNIAIRLGPVSLDLSDLRRVIHDTLAPVAVTATQAVLTHVDGRDGMMILAVAQPSDGQESAKRFLLALWRERPMLERHSELGLIGDIVLSFVPWEKLVISPRSGKTMDIVDRRLGGT